MNEFIKSRKTKAPVSNSRSEIEKMLRRYGATGFSVQQQFSEKGEPESVNIQFIVPDTAGSKARVPISLPIDIRRVYDRMFGRPTKRVDGRLVFDPSGYYREQLDQAERVAWRNLVLWIDAALSAASIGLQTVTEAFFAHTVLRLEDGSQARMIDLVERESLKLGAGVRALLSPPTEG